MSQPALLPAFAVHTASAARPGWRETEAAGKRVAAPARSGRYPARPSRRPARAGAAHGYRVIAPDHAGHTACLPALPHAGQASICATGRGRTAALIEHLGLRDVVVAGPVGRWGRLVGLGN
ncbi:hypothetical protein ACU4GD_06855 [Cupriavidus basilensis]